MAQDLVDLTCVKIDETTQRPPRNRMTVLLSLEIQDLLPSPPSGETTLFEKIETDTCFPMRDFDC